MRIVGVALKSKPIITNVSISRYVTPASIRNLSTTTVRRSDHLRLVFDDQKYFRNFNKDSESKVGPLPSLLSNKKTGLFKNENLSTPDGLIEFSKVSLKQAKQLVELMIQEAKSNEVGKLNYINRLDQLSDILCRVIDVAEFIRVAHPSEKWINAAQQTHEIMFEYMNQLNTNVELYKHLRDILNDSNITERLSEEEVQVGEYLKQDFERSGIHMDPTTRDNFVAITQEISKLGSQFGNGIHKLEAYWCEVSRLEFESIKNPNLKKEILKHQGPLSNDAKSVSIPLIGHIPYSILTDCDTESVRRKVWISLHNSPEGQVHTLNEFLKSRALLASMLGYKSFAHYQLEHKMAKNPENVVTFLNNLQTSLRKHGVLDELRNLYKYKEENSTERNASDEVIFKSIRPWDRDYLLSKLHEESHDNEKQLQNINEYFSVGTIISGLSKLFTSIYNIEFVPEATIMGETWDQAQVRKVKVVDLSANKTLGYLYLDFWSPKVLPSHFTIVCSRKINNTENVNDLRHLVQLDESEEFQLPVISLICNFQRSASSFGKFAGLKGKEATLLSLDQVDTIFHEMGHAMHSMIGKTNLHNLSGTRCATDFVELPSVLMESFSNDPRVLCKIGRHHITGELLPESLLKKHQENRVILGDCETYMQLKMAMLDQVLHDDYIVQNLPGSFYDFDSTPVYHDLEKKLSIFADDVSTWHGKFPHLFSYGAVYYSYLLDRAIAEKIWKGLFKDDPWSRQAGEKYKNSILKWGGTRDPWVCLADALDNQELSKGDSKAMEIIGSDALSV